MEQPKYTSTCVERFLEYVRIDTQSAEDAESFPSTPGQLDLLRLLVDQLSDLGLKDVTIDEHGYVFATIPATTKKEHVPTIGFIAHVDTSPEMPGADVEPLIHENYQGQDLVLPEDPSVVIRLQDNPHLREQIGNTIITASGKTLLGADNKAGIAEIVGVAEYLMAHPEIPHGTIRLGFTPDEEIASDDAVLDTDDDDGDVIVAKGADDDDDGKSIEEDVLLDDAAADATDDDDATAATAATAEDEGPGDAKTDKTAKTGDGKPKTG